MLLLTALPCYMPVLQYHHSASTECPQRAKGVLLVGFPRQPFIDSVLPHQEQQQWLTCAPIAGSTCLQVTIDKDKTLTIEGERKLEHEENDEGVRRIERSYGVFVRRFQVCGCNEGHVHPCFEEIRS